MRKSQDSPAQASSTPSSPSDQGLGGAEASAIVVVSRRTSKRSLPSEPRQSLTFEVPRNAP